MVKVTDEEYEYDAIAEKIFFPIYDIIADHIIETTGIKTGKVLDIGCGGGHLGLTLLKKTDLEGCFFDINHLAIGIAKKRALDWQLDRRTYFSIQDVHEMTYDENTFDLIISRGSMGFWENQEIAFKEIYRVLAPGGKTYIGSGLGNFETKKKIKKAMQKVEPDWPENLKKKLKSLTTKGYEELFTDLGFDFTVIENSEQGRWFVIEKPVSEG